MNNLPLTGMPSNVAHLVCFNDGQPVAPDIDELHASNFAFDIIPFVTIFAGWLKCSDSLTDNSSFGLTFEDGPILHCTFIFNVAKRSALSALCSLHKGATRRKLVCAYVLEINHNGLFTAANAAAQFATIHNQGVEDNFPITSVLKTKLKASDVCKHINKSSLFVTMSKWDKNEDINKNNKFMDRAANPLAHLKKLQAQIQNHLWQTEDDMEISVPTLDIQSLRAMYKL